MKLTFRKLFTVFKVIIVDKLYKTFLLLETKMLTEIKYIQPPLPPKLILIQIPMKHFSFSWCNKYRNKCENRKKKLIKYYNSTQRLYSSLILMKTDIWHINRGFMGALKRQDDEQ